MSPKLQFEKLLEPYRIGNVKIKNRIVKTAAETCTYNENDGFVTETCKAFYEAMAKGGAGAVYVEGPAIDGLISKANQRGFGIDDDMYIPGLSELVEVIHNHDCPAFIQLLHAGPWHMSFISGIKPVASSAREPEFPGFEAPRELSAGEIDDLVDKFANAAVRARKAGFDGVDINSGGSHLLSTFLSSHWNRRNDEFGRDTLENRSRIHVRIIREIKSRLGDNFNVGVLFNGLEYGNGDVGVSIQDACGFAKIFEDEGVASIQIRSHRYGSVAALWPEHLFYPEPLPDLPQEIDWGNHGAGAYGSLAGHIKKTVSVPVITVGRFDPVLGESAIREGKADIIGLNRRLMADPEMPNKIASGRLEDIAPCTACLCCLDRVMLCEPIRCRINASLGHEKSYYSIKKAENKKRVLVVGGGPSGMEAARISAMRGHDVTLYAMEKKLGGLLRVAALVKGLAIEDLETIIHYFKIQLKKLKVTLELGKKVDMSLIERIKPDVLILATGGTPVVPDIPGVEGPNVVSGPELYKRVKFFLRFFGPRFLRKMTKLWMPIGNKVAVLGGAIQGCEVAEFLVKRGRSVTILDTDGELGSGLGPENKRALFEWLVQKGAVMMPRIKYEKITDKGIIVKNDSGTQIHIDADTIITAMPLASDTGIPYEFKKTFEMHIIGDAREPHLIIDAIAGGSKTGRLI